MNQFFNDVEFLLSNMAEPFISISCTPKAITHQWMHAIANDSQLYGISSIKKKNEIINKLKSSGLYLNKNQFKKEIDKINLFPSDNEYKFKFIDLFAGIGGFRIALQRNGGYCTFSSEWDASAQQTYMKNYAELPFGDITEITNKKNSDRILNKLIPDHDVLAAGFPCQPFSHAGVSARNSVGQEHGFKCNTQGTLFFDIMRIAYVKKPKVLFLENARNIERHDGGKTFQVIRDSIEELGYDFRYKIIDSSSLVAQRRVRCYMVCFRKDLNVDFQFPDISGAPIPLKTILQDNDSVPDSFTISKKLWEGHINRTKRNIERGTGFTAHLADINKPSKTIVARYGKDGKECLIPQENKECPRLLTLSECAKLFGYPENFIYPEAKTPAYKQFGNSVAIPVIQTIAKNIVNKII